jgi:mannose-1-phosphate guanylyltransferase
MHSSVTDSSHRQIRCGIVLSAGDGTRLREFVHQKRGDGLPKQYNAFVGSRSMLEHTFDRAERLIPAQRLFVIVAQEHLAYREVHRQLKAKALGRVIVQPANKETAPGILLPLLYIQKRYPDAVVALFPSDHFILEEDRFMRHVDHAFRVVESDPARMVLLGLSPRRPNPEYGYIVPGERIAPRHSMVKPVKAFVEKPSIETARNIIAGGALWNTMVMISTCKSLLAAIRGAAPALHRSFKPIENAIGTADEQRVIEKVYRTLPSLNFSRGILEALPGKHRPGLAVLPVHGVTWSDWGTRERVSHMLRQLGKSGPAAPPRAVSQRKKLPSRSNSELNTLRL